MSSSPGTHPLCISIGNMPISLHIREKFLLVAASRRYREFSTLSTNGLPVFLNELRQERGGGGRFDYNLDGATITVAESQAEFNGVRHEYALDLLLQILLTVMLLPRRGFLLHAATVVRGGQAYVFMGRSGAAKSTVASLSPKGSVLTDEIEMPVCLSIVYWGERTPMRMEMASLITKGDALDGADARVTTSEFLGRVIRLNRQRRHNRSRIIRANPAGPLPRLDVPVQRCFLTDAAGLQANPAERKTPPSLACQGSKSGEEPRCVHGR